MSTTQELTLNVSLDLIKGAADIVMLHRYTDRAYGCIRRWFANESIDQFEARYNRIMILKAYQKSLLRLHGKEV